MNGILWIVFGLLIVVLGNWFIINGNLKISKQSETKIISQTRKSEQKLSDQLKSMNTSLQNLSQTITPQNFKEYYPQAKFNYEAGLQYQQIGKNAQAAQAFVLFRNIAIQTNSLQAAAGSSIIAAWRFEDIKDFSKAGELQSDAGDIYINLGDIQEGIIWKKAALNNYKNANIVVKVSDLTEEIQRLTNSRGPHF